MVYERKKIHQSLYVSAVLTRRGFFFIFIFSKWHDALQLQKQEQCPDTTYSFGLYPEEVVTSGAAAVFVWFPLLIFCLSGSWSPASSQRDHYSPPPLHNLFMLALINSLCSYNRTHTLIEKWKRGDLF